MSCSTGFCSLVQIAPSVTGSSPAIDLVRSHSASNPYQVRPRLHPNGFIQIDLPAHPITGEEKRLHVWPASPLPTQKTKSPIHDHRFTFDSRILRGGLHNITYRFDPTGHSMYERTEVHRLGNDETMLISTGEVGDLIKLSDVYYPTGDEYGLSAFVYHESIPLGLTVTLMRKRHEYHHHEASVMVPFGEAPDNDYSRNSTSPELLWSIIEPALEGLSAAALY